MGLRFLYFGDGLLIFWVVRVKWRDHGGYRLRIEQMSDQMLELSKRLVKIANALGVKFTLRNEPVVFGEVFSDTGLLPGIARRADQLCSLCLGYGIGASFEKAEVGPLKRKVSFDDVTPSVLRYLCITDVLCDFIYAAPSKDAVPLDALLYDWWPAE